MMGLKLQKKSPTQFTLNILYQIYRRENSYILGSIYKYECCSSGCIILKRVNFDSDALLKLSVQYTNQFV